MLINGKTVYDTSIIEKRIFEFATYNKPSLRVYYENNKHFFRLWHVKKGILNASKAEKRVYYALQNLKPLFFTVHLKATISITWNLNSQVQINCSNHSTLTIYFAKPQQITSNPTVLLNCIKNGPVEGELRTTTFAIWRHYPANADVCKHIWKTNNLQQISIQLFSWIQENALPTDIHNKSHSK